jgi:hypothetical protein
MSRHVSISVLRVLVKGLRRPLQPFGVPLPISRWGGELALVSPPYAKRGEGDREAVEGSGKAL